MVLVVYVESGKNERITMKGTISLIVVGTIGGGEYHQPVMKDGNDLNNTKLIAHSFDYGIGYP